MIYLSRYQRLVSIEACTSLGNSSAPEFRPIDNVTFSASGCSRRASGFAGALFRLNSLRTLLKNHFSFLVQASFPYSKQLKRSGFAQYGVWLMRQEPQRIDGDEVCPHVLRGTPTKTRSGSVQPRSSSAPRRSNCPLSLLSRSSNISAPKALAHAQTGCARGRLTRRATGPGD